VIKRDTVKAAHKTLRLAFPGVCVFGQFKF